MIAELVILLLIVHLLIFNGMILYRAAANRLFDASATLTETQLFTQGIFLSFLMNGIIGQYLAIFHLFRLSVFIAIFVFNLIFFRTEAAQIAGYALRIPSRLFLSAKNNSIEFFAWLLFISIFLLLLLRVQIPSQNIDVWVQHIPIAESIVNHKGFIYPIVSHLFYGNMPSFVELLFAEGLVFTGNYNIANLIHYLIYVSLLLLLFSFSSKWKLPALIILCFMLINSFFWYSAVSAMTDTAHACFAVASIVFLLKSFENRGGTTESYYLFFSAILCGAALASKYLELISLFLCGLIFLIHFKPSTLFFKKVGIYLVGIFLVAGFWYGKSTMTYGNPIYPYIFGHEGLSDEWMAGLKEDQGKSFDPQYRQYSRNILSVAGWRDFAKATRSMFFDPRTFRIMTGIILVAVILVRTEANLLIFASINYFILWYFFVFHHPRYGITAYLLFLTSFYLSFISLIEKGSHSELIHRIGELKYFPFLKKTAIVFIVIFAALGIFLKKEAIANLSRGGFELAQAYTDIDFFESYMGREVPYYKLYSFIAKNKLIKVLNPLDNGSILEMKYIIPGAKPDDTFLPWTTMCRSIDELDSFIENNGIKYFVYLGSLSPVALERLGKEHTEITFKVFKVLMMKSEQIYSDGKGNALYRITGGNIGNGRHHSLL